MVSPRCLVTVILSTFNRAGLLGPAIDALLSQSAAAPDYELIVVDNNSTDETAQVVQSRMGQASARGRLRYLFERQQGLSSARNAGIAAARSEIVAFTDDDVRVADNWVRVLYNSFEAHPQVDCVGGRILPIWESPPPAWLTRRHWVGTLALQDYGDEPLFIDRERPVSLAGANFAFRRHVFDSLGGFPPEYARAEDSEFLLRFWRSGHRALYVPEMVIYALVQAERLRKEYHRRWHVHSGSPTRLAEELSAAALAGGERRQIARILGVPRFALKELTTEALSWFVDLVRGRESDAFWHEGQIRELVAYMRDSRKLYRRTRTIPSSPAAGPVTSQPQDTGIGTRSLQ
jgi:glucosyl-dolichyl phosphate glucuronosyltransferase